jgi:hypothetical protein
MQILLPQKRGQPEKDPEKGTRVFPGRTTMDIRCPRFHNDIKNTTCDGGL